MRKEAYKWTNMNTNIISDFNNRKQIKQCNTLEKYQKASELNQKLEGKKEKNIKQKKNRKNNKYENNPHKKSSKKRNKSSKN